MVNLRLRKLADRLGNKDLPKMETPEPPKEQPIVVPEKFSYSFLGGDFGKKVNGMVQLEYKNIPALQKPSYEDDVVKGSNPFYAVAVNQVIRSSGLRTATSYDLQRIIEDETLNLRDVYEDCGLVLFSEDEPNKYLAEHLAGQIKARQGQGLEFPVMIPLCDLDLGLDKNSECGLVFKLREDSKIIYAPQLSSENNGKKFSEVFQNGVPIFDENGKYAFYMSDRGLRVLFRDGYLGLGAGDGVLTDSGSDGRVIICGEATPK